MVDLSIPRWIKKYATIADSFERKKLIISIIVMLLLSLLVHGKMELV